MEKHDARAAQDEDHGQKYRHFKGIRKRKWGKWVSEIRMPGSKERIWLGSYKTAEQAARAYDAAVYCLRGADGKLNFPDSLPAIPSASSLSLSRQQIQHAAAKYALDEIPSTSSILHNEAREKPASPSPSSWISEMDLSSISQLELESWESLFNSSDCLNLEKSLSINEPLALGLIQTSGSQQEEQNEV